MSAEHLILTDNDKNCIVCFGGMMSKMDGILPFEFLTFLNRTYDDINLYFYIDKHQNWYHNGIAGISNDIDSTVIYLKEKISIYKNVIFLGVSAGGYAALLFGSLCNVNTVIAFIPRTYIINPKNEYYRDINSVINNKTKYIIYGDMSERNINSDHHISQCERLIGNVEIVKINKLNIKQMRDNGQLKELIDNFLIL